MVASAYAAGRSSRSSKMSWRVPFGNGRSLLRPLMTVADHPAAQRQQSAELIGTVAAAEHEPEPRSTRALMPPLAFQTGDADFFPQPVVERRGRERVLRGPRRARVLERKRVAGQSGLQSPAALLRAPLTAQKGFDQPRLVAVREVGLHVHLGLGADIPRQRRAELDGQLRQLDARDVFEACITGPAAVTQLARATVGPARKFGSSRERARRSARAARPGWFPHRHRTERALPAARGRSRRTATMRLKRSRVT